MTSESQPQPNPIEPSVPPPPPAERKRRGSKRRKKLIIASVSTAVAMAFIGSGAGLAYSSNSGKLDEYQEAVDTLTSTHTEASDLVEKASPLEPEAQEELETELTKASGLMGADAPGIMSFSIDDRTNELRDSNDNIQAAQVTLQEAVDHRDAHTSAASEAAGVLEDAEELLKSTKDKVDDKDTYKALSGHVKTLKEALKEAPDEASGTAFADGASAIEDASSSISDASPKVSASHDKWKKAEEEAAKRDPANYKVISDRDWDLIERNPDAHVGEKYVVYGAVTQADANTGILSIRVDTGGVKKSQWYDYDINTIVTADSLNMFSDVVQDDHLKMLIEVTGSTSYDTMIGGSATAVDVTAYDVEVIGRF